MKIRLTEEIWKEGNMYVSYCPELDIASCGHSIEQAKRNLYEVILINIEETQKPGKFEALIQEAGFEKIEVPVFVIQNNMKVIGLDREAYLQILENV